MILEGIAEAIVGLAKAAVGVANVLQTISDAFVPEEEEEGETVALRGVPRWQDMDELDEESEDEEEIEDSAAPRRTKIGFKRP